MAQPQKQQITLSAEQMVAVAQQVLKDMKTHYENPEPNDNIAPDVLRSIVHTQNLLGVFWLRLIMAAKKQQEKAKATTITKFEGVAPMD